MFSQGTFTNPNILGDLLGAQWLEKRQFRRFMGGKDGCGWDIQTMEDFSCRWFRFTPPNASDYRKHTPIITLLIHIDLRETRNNKWWTTWYTKARIILIKISSIKQQKHSKRREQQNNLPSSLSFRTETAFLQRKKSLEKNHPRKPMTTRQATLPAFRQTNLPAFQKRRRSGRFGKKTRRWWAVYGGKLYHHEGCGGGSRPNGMCWEIKMWVFQIFFCSPNLTFHGMVFICQTSL